MSVASIKSVLVVDDSRLARMLISKYILSIYPHWLIIEANSGLDAIEKSRTECPNYITMDYNMEGMSGAEASRQILLDTPHAAIVLFTANIQASTRGEAESLGIHFVGKPVTEKSVQQALNYFQSRA